jgi:hypothetical protein
MTLEDLRISLNNFMPEWCEIERADDGEIVIRTGLIETTTGELVTIDAAEVRDE